MLVVAGFVVSAGGEPIEVAGSTTTTTDPTTTTTLVATTEPSGSATSTTAVVEPDLEGRTGGRVAVRIDNAPAARPQWGLAAADLLVEFPVEGGLTRFTAIIPESLDGLMGPIRSLRPVDGDLLPAISRVVVSSGGQEFVLREVVAAGVEPLTAGFSSLFPGVGNPDPYDTFVDLELLSDTVSRVQGEAFGLPSGNLPEDGGEASTIVMPFSGVSFVFDDVSGYTRHLNQSPFIVLDTDGASETPLTHDILVVMFVGERDAGYSDSNEVLVSDFDVIGSGELLIFHSGQVHVGTWSRSAQADPYLFFDQTGDEIGVPEGRIYLGLVPRDEKVSY